MWIQFKQLHFWIALLINPPTGDRSTEQQTSWTSEKNGADDELHGQIFETTRNEHHLLQTIRRRGHPCSDFLLKTPSKCWSKIRETNKSIRQRNRTKPPKNSTPTPSHPQTTRHYLKPKKHPGLHYFAFFYRFYKFLEHLRTKKNFRKIFAPTNRMLRSRLLSGLTGLPNQPEKNLWHQ